MKEIKFTVEKFFDEDHEIIDDFIEAVKNGEVKNVEYNVINVESRNLKFEVFDVDEKKLKKGDYDFSFEMKGHKYVMDPEMSPYYALKIIELFKKIAFKFIHKKPEKLNRLLNYFKKTHWLKNRFEHCNEYYVENVIGVEDNIVCPNKYYDKDSGEYDYTNVTDEDVMNDFYFTWYKDPNCCFDYKKPDDDEIYKLIKKNGGVEIVVTYKDCDFVCCCIKDLDIYGYYNLKRLVEVYVESIRHLVTRTYFEEKPTL